MYYRIDPEGFRRLPDAKTLERGRKYRWSAPGKAKVIHPACGAVVVPSRSNFAAILNAAEVWQCDWADILDAGVWATEPGEEAVKMPYII